MNKDSSIWHTTLAPPSTTGTESRDVEHNVYVNQSDVPPCLKNGVGVNIVLDPVNNVPPGQYSLVNNVPLSE